MCLMPFNGKQNPKQIIEFLIFNSLSIPTFMLLIILQLKLSYLNNQAVVSLKLIEYSLFKIRKYLINVPYITILLSTFSFPLNAIHFCINFSMFKLQSCYCFDIYIWRPSTYIIINVLVECNSFFVLLSSLNYLLRVFDLMTEKLPFLI